MYQHQINFLNRVRDAFEEVFYYQSSKFDKLDPALTYESDPTLVDRIRLPPLGVVDLRYVMRLSMTEDRKYLVELTFAADSSCLPTRSADFEVTHQATLDKEKLDEAMEKLTELTLSYFGPSATRPRPSEIDLYMEEYNQKSKELGDEYPFLRVIRDLEDRAFGEMNILPKTRMKHEHDRTFAYGERQDVFLLTMVAYDLAVEMLTHLFYHPKGLAVPILQNSYLAALERMGVAKVDEESPKYRTKRRRSE